MEIISRKEAKELGLKRYFTGKPCNHGHVAERTTSSCGCIVCHRERNAAMYREKGENYRVASKKWKAKNASRISEYKATYREKECRKMEGRRYLKKYPERFFIRNSMARILGNTSGKMNKHEKAHGYTCKELRDNLLSKFYDGMSWSNHGEWHIDHIKPIKAFLDEGITDPAVINALDNLQPLWAHENLSKGAKWEMENIK